MDSIMSVLNSKSGVTGTANEVKYSDIAEIKTGRLNGALVEIKPKLSEMVLKEIRAVR